LSSARLDELLPAHVKRVTERDTPIPTIAQQATAARRTHPELVRADIGQVVGIEPAAEVLYGPPVGLEPLRAAIAELYNRTYGFDRTPLDGLPAGLDARNVAITSGAAEAISVLLRCFASGRAVVLPRGHWENYRNAVDLADGRAVIADFFDASGALDTAGLERCIRAEAAAVLVVNFPCNPTGAVLDAEETRRLGELARATGVVLLADEVYARLRYDGVPPQTILRHAPGHAVSVGSASKEYLVPGARVGWVVSAQSDLTDRVVRRLVRASTASPNVLGQERVLPAIGEDLDDLRAGREPERLAALRAALARRRDRLLAVLESHGMTTVGRPGHRPGGTIFLCAALPAWWSGDDASFARRALELGLFSVIPGSAFGVVGAVRFSFGATSETDLARLDHKLAALRAAARDGVLEKSTC
jgi:aspartate/methionine/tyrosine aminotransferase